MPTIDPKTVLLDYKGKPLMRREAEDSEPDPLTFAAAVQAAMSMPLQTDQGIEYKQKWLMHKLAERCERESASFNAKETVMILERVSKVFGATVFGRVKEMIEPEEDEQPQATVRTNGDGAHAPA
jgi:hypothetical protein